MKEVASVREALPTDAGAEGASTFAQKLAVGHQEIDRIIDEVEQIYNSQPMEWCAPTLALHLPLHGSCAWREQTSRTSP
jgi:hypothetical protein|tara:strand:+ start:1423 stop:1659 length:237 start_codon:yes stop_codon:yes gene_type:complete